MDEVQHNFIDEVLCVLNNKIPIRLQRVYAKASDCENYDILVPQLNFYNFFNSVLNHTFTLEKKDQILNFEI